jgi:hypothetical protein
LCSAEELEIREAVVRHLLRLYDEMEPQFDDPIGRRYCLGFDFRLGSAGKAAPAEFVERFSGHPDVHGLDWCATNDGRVLSVGPVQCKHGQKSGRSPGVGAGLVAPTAAMLW